MAADEAVIHPERQQDSSPEIARDARLIRQSLERLQARDEAGALVLLRDLARSSVLSEWKFFVRGLAAYYRHESDDVKANWDRLDPKRKAFPIAQRLLRLMGDRRCDRRAARTPKRWKSWPLVSRSLTGCGSCPAWRPIRNGTR